MQKCTLTPLILLLLTLTVLSCKNDDEQPDPKLDFQISTDGNVEVMHQTETLIASFENEKDIKTVFFTVDGRKIAEDSEAPYEVEWNTLDTSDGDHTLIVTAINAAGTPFQSTLQVRVSNIFVTIEATPGYLTSGNSEAWYYISDVEGNIISEPTKLKEGQAHKALRPEGFTSEKYNFNLFEIIDHSGGFKACYIDTYTGLTPGKYFAHGFTPQQKGAPIDEFTVTVDRNTTDPEHIFLLSNSGAIEGNYSETGPTSLIQHKVYDENESNRYYLTYQPEIGFDYAFYKKLEHSADTEEYHYDVLGFTPMDKKTLPLNVTPTSKSSDVFGIDGTDRYYIYQGSSNDVSKAIPFYTIDAEFEEYIYSFVYTAENNTWVVYGKGDPSAAEFIENTVQASFTSDDLLTVESIGTADYLQVTGFFSQADFSFQQAYFGANDGKPVIFPEVPELLKEKYPKIVVSQEQEQKIDIYLTDFKNLDSYTDWLNMRFSKESPEYWDYYGGYKEIIKTLDATTASGRQKTNAFLNTRSEKAALRNGSFRKERWQY